MTGGGRTSGAVAGVALLVVAFAACEGRSDPASTPGRERDEIYASLALAAVLEDWQSEEQRGHNIGALLVAPDGSVVGHALNRRHAARDSTQHAEVRVIQRYLRRENRSFLDGFTLYATLEPCAMCAGMATLTAVERVVYAQSDAYFGGVFERLRSRDCGGDHGAYPMQVVAEPLASPLRSRLEDAFERAAGPDGRLAITDWLRTGEARAVFRHARDRLCSYETRFTENEQVLEGALVYLRDRVAGDRADVCSPVMGRNASEGSVPREASGGF